MQLKNGFISVDDHVQEPPDLWTARLSKRQWGERIPRLEHTADGSERWVVDGQVLLEGRVARAGAFMADINGEPTRWDEVPPAAYVPAERLKVMDAAGVDGSALFPTVAGLAGEAFGRLQDPELELACVRAYNDWLIEEWSGASERFIPQCIVPVWPPAATVAEIRRAVGMGHRGVVFPGVPMELRDVPYLGEAEWDPVWTICEELDVPLCLHAGGSQQVPYAPSPPLAEALAGVMTAVNSSTLVTLFLFSRVALRHERLRLVFAESALSWGMIHLEWTSHQFEGDGLSHEPWTYAGVEHAGYELTPIEMFRRQCYFNGWYDQVTPFANYFGADHILWSTNFPLATSTWPHTQETISRCFHGLSIEAREQVLWRSAARLYKLAISGPDQEAES
ncbi:MAG: amidohydrolase family protein [Chloroflexi bacterium]|nr:amidohydrolase family protein [Chloroflexota bacterium]